MLASVHIMSAHACRLRPVHCTQLLMLDHLEIEGANAAAKRRNPAICLQEAAFIECDVALTSDCGLICRHEPLLSGTTNADEVFANKLTSYNIDDRQWQVGSGDLRWVGDVGVTAPCQPCCLLGWRLQSN